MENTLIVALSSKAQLTSPTLEDWILLLSPVLSAGAGSSLNGILPGTSSFVLGVIIAALGKSLVSLGAEPKSKEDWWLFVFTFFGILITALTGNSQYALAGTIIGFAGKSVGTLIHTVALEDILLLVGSGIAFYGILTGSTNTTNTGLLLLSMGKALPSLGTNGKLSPLKGPKESTKPPQ
jgi:hypothetical protein